MQYVNLNGKIVEAGQAVVPVDNSAFRYGYGLFETILIQDGEIRLWEYHWQRLLRGFTRIYFDAPFVSMEEAKAEVQRTVAENKMEQLCRVRLQVYATGEGLYCTTDLRLHYVIECFPLEAGIAGLNRVGLVVDMAEWLNVGNDWRSGIKSCNALIYALAARQAKEYGWHDALLCNTEGNIIESTTANIFWVKDGSIFTPPLADGCVNGVMRRYVMEKAAVTEKSLSSGELMHADEVFLTNAIRGIRWIKRVGSVSYSNEQVTGIYTQVYD